MTRVKMSSRKVPKHIYARLYMNYLIVFALEDIEKIKMKKLHRNSLNNHTSVYKFWNSFYFPSMKIHQQAKLVRNYKISPFEFSKPLKGIFDKAVKINCTIADWTECARLKAAKLKCTLPLATERLKWTTKNARSMFLCDWEILYVADIKFYSLLCFAMAQICFNFFHLRCKKTALT